MALAMELGLDLDSLRGRIAGSEGFPLHTYWQPDVFEFELEAIFAGAWRYFVPLERLSTPGDVVIGTLGRTPIGVACAEDGALHGFVNICRHRGYPVVQQDQRAGKLLRCQYHSWSYRLDGSLVAAPDTQNEPGFDKCKFGLVPISVDTWGGAVFVNSDPAAMPLRDFHPQMEKWTREKGFVTDPAKHKLHSSFETEIKANWKLWYDNGTECYHCPTIHGQSFADAFDVDADAYTTGFEGQMTTYSHVGAPTNDPTALRSTYYHSMQIFPGTQIIQQDDLMILAYMNPTGPETCVFHVDYLSEEGADPERVQKWVDIWNTTYDEDAEAVELQQRNTRSRLAPGFRYVANREGPTLFINNLIVEAYLRNLSAQQAEPV